MRTIDLQQQRTQFRRILCMEETLVSLLIALVSALIIVISFEIYIGL